MMIESSDEPTIQSPLVAVVPDEAVQLNPKQGRLVFARMIMDGEPLELRVLNHPEGTLSGVFSTPKDLAAAAAKVNGEGDVYVTPNPVTLEPVDLRVIGLGEGASKEDISRIRWFLVDVDAYDDEVVGATAEAVKEFLGSLGFPAPLMQSSGNGYQFWYRYDGPNTDDEQGLRQRALRALAGRFPGIDVAVHDPNRIMRYAYTANLNRKGRGDGGPRLARLITPADTVLEVLSRERLEALAEMAAPVGPGVSPEQGVVADLEVVRKALEERGITLTNPHPADKAPGTIWQLSGCPFFPEGHHGSHTAAYLIAWDDGRVHFECQGNRCQEADHRINDLLELLDIRTIRNPKKPGAITLIRMADVRSRRIEFYFGHRKVRGDVNAWVGDEKIGKGLVMVRFASDLSTGKVAELAGRPMRIVYASTEERLEAVVKPRFEAAGADPDFVRYLPMGSIGLPDCIPELAKAMGADRAEYLFLDPINKHFSPGLDPLKSKDVGIVMGELAKMASEHGITVDGALHTNRSGALSPREKVAHSLEFARAVRSSVFVGRRREDERLERTLVHAMPNYSDIDPALKAVIKVVTLVIEGRPSEQAVLEYTDEVEADVAELFLAEADREGAIAEAKSARGAKAQAMQNILGRWKQLGSPGKVAGRAMAGAMKDVPPVTAHRARSQLGIKTIQTGDEGWEWQFPDSLRDA